MKTFLRSKSWWSFVLACAACGESAPSLVASNCDQATGCVQKEALQIDAVDILLVIDDSNSVVGKANELKAQLPRMLKAITTGRDGDVSFPPARSVHVAVTTSDMGTGSEENAFTTCSAEGRDGMFVRPGEVGLTCDVSYPGYLVYEGGPAPVSVVESVGCVPLVFTDVDANGAPRSGCGFEQPLEAALKSVWPDDDDSLEFLNGHGHGSAANAGFLRDNSLLVVIVVTDEDDCSTIEPGIFSPANRGGPYAEQPINLRCFLNPDKLLATSRYTDALKKLRPHNDNVIFAAIGGVPPELVADEFRARYDFDKPAQADQYFADVLAASGMQEQVDPEFTGGTEILKPSCNVALEGLAQRATPPRRLVQVARGFGAQGVLGSICAPDFGATTGTIIRALGEKLGGNDKR